MTNRIFNKIIIPSVIFAVLSAFFTWQFTQHFEMIYLYFTLLIGFIGWRIGQAGIAFKQRKTIRILLYALILVFAVDVTNTGIYLFEGHGLFFENGTLAAAGVAFIGSSLLLLFSFLKLRSQLKIARNRR